MIFLKAKILLRNFHTKDFLKIEIYKIYRKINSWSKFEDRSPMKLMSKMQIKLENSLPVLNDNFLFKFCFVLDFKC